MIGYQKPCRYCDELIPPTSNTCPNCGRVNPLSSRCPRCKTPLRAGWSHCPSCGLKLRIDCPYCGEKTFFGDYCDKCDARLLVRCTGEKCRLEQPPLGEVCIECGKPVEKIESISSGGDK
ncbi:MAG: double zinc ribbon domain-containing protein [Bacillota bacterium]